jgi:hypothetical protein
LPLEDLSWDGLGLGLGMGVFLTVSKAIRIYSSVDLSSSKEK